MRAGAKKARNLTGHHPGKPSAVDREDAEVALLVAVEATGGVAGVLDEVRRARQRYNGHRTVALLEALARWAEPNQ